MSLNKYLTPSQVAKLLQVSPVTVRHWSLEGKLKFITTPGGHRRYLSTEVKQFALSNGVNIDKNQRSYKSVLIVDDNTELAEFVSELLKREVPDIVVEVAHDGFEAGKKLHTFYPDVVLLDLMMPGMDGFDTCRRIKENPTTKDVRVISMTGYPSEENVQKILDAGAEVCLSKPVRAPTLIAALGLNSKAETLNEIS